MARGKIYKSSLNKIKDKKTGIEVIRLSSKQGNSVRPYFTPPLFSDDEKYLYGQRFQLKEDWNNYDLFIKPDGSCKEKFSYPGSKPMHVQVSSDDKNVVFNSDREGKVNIYLAPADWETLI